MERRIIKMAKNKKRDEVIAKLYKKHPIDEMVSFTECDLQEKLQENTFNVVKYTDLYQKELDIYEKMKIIKDRITGERYDHFRFNYNKELKLQEIEKYYLPKDIKIIKVDMLLRRQKWRVDFFAMCVDGFKKQQWNMKIFWESLKRGL